MPTNVSKYVNPRYINSDNSNTVAIGALNTPQNFRRLGALLDWSPVEFAQFYEVYDNDVLVVKNVNSQYNMPTQTVGTHNYKVRAIRTDDNNVSYVSGFTDIITFTVTKLDAPVIAFNQQTSEVYWSAITNADHYDVYVNGLLETTLDTVPTQVDPYIVNKNVAGEYSITVVARNDDSFLFISSDESNVLTYTVYKFSTPVVTLNAETKTITWPVSKAGDSTLIPSTEKTANVYDIYLNDEFYISVTSPSYTFSLPEGSYVTKVKAYRDDNIPNANPMYIESDFSTDIEFGQLGTPVITISDNTISWQPVENAVQYEVYDYDTLLITISDTSYSLESSSPRAFSIRVKAISSTPETLLDSAYSNTIAYYITKLSNPTIQLVDTSTISITPVLNADYYEIYVNEKLRETVTQTYINLTLYAGYNNIYVIAKSNLYCYLDSSPSNMVITNVLPDTQTIIKVYDRAVNDYVAYPLIYPFSFNETIDESLDVAKCITAGITVKDPFEAYSDASLYIYSGDTPVFGFPRHMLISEDDVEEIQTGEGQLYKHNITLIERTKKLETEIMPDFSVTQPLEYVLWDNLPSNQKRHVQPMLGTNTDYLWSSDMVCLERRNISLAQYLGCEDIWDFLGKYLGISTWYQWVAYIAANVGLFFLTGAAGVIEEVAILNGVWRFLTGFTNRVNVTCNGIHKSNIIGELNYGYDKSVTTKIPLPIEDSKSFDTFVNIRYDVPDDDKKWWQWVLDVVSNVLLVASGGAILGTAMTVGLFGGYIINGIWPETTQYHYNSLDDRGIHLTRRYYYRPHTSDFDSNTGRVLIATVKDNEQPIWDISSLASGEYDIIMEIDPVNPRDLYYYQDQISTYANEEHFHTYDGSLSNMNLMYNTNVPLPDPETPPYKMNVTPDNVFKPYRVVWGCKDDQAIVISNTQAVVDQSLNEPDHRTVADVLDRILNMVQPLSYKNSKLDTPKYSLDPSIRILAQDIACPELTFTGTKSLYEVLKVIGRVLMGVPRLGLVGETTPSNTITYDIINFDRLNRTNPNFTDANVKEGIKSTIDNHVSGYVSDLKNVTTTDYWTSYPVGDLYTTARADSYVSTSVTVSSMCIEVDKPIYKIMDIWITNYDKRDPNAQPLSLKNFVYEKTLFNALNNNRNGKGLALCYTQGDTRIMGLGQLPEESQLYSILGFSSDDYVIENILTTIYGVGTNNMNSPHNFKYKVFYIPCHDTKVYTEQSNLSGLSNETYKVLNQDDNVINDSNFGKSAQTQIERLGNNNINKTYRLYEYFRIPYLGQVKEYDGYKYYADNIVISYYNNYIDAQVSYSKNFNKINERIGVNSLYRLYEIENKNIVNRTININNYCYLTTEEALPNYSDVSTKALFNTGYKIVDDIKHAFNNDYDFANPQIKPDTFYIRNMTKDNTRLKYIDYYGNVLDVPAVAVPATYNTFKNNICFSGKMYDNFAAGSKATDEMFGLAWYEKLVDDAYKAITGDDSGFYEEKQYYTQTDVRYCDNKGQNEVMGITLCKPTQSSLRLSGVDLSRSFPEVNYVNSPKYK